MQLAIDFRMKKRLIHRIILIYLLMLTSVGAKKFCPQSDTILPCRCAPKGEEIQIWCSHSNLPQIIEGIRAVEQLIQDPIDEFILENNQLPALPGRFFGSLRIVRLMLRYNGIERVSNGWLNQLEKHLIEIFMVEPTLRSIPKESLYELTNLEAITIHSSELKRIPDFSGLINLKYLNINSKSLIELPATNLKHLPKLENIHLNGGQQLSRLEAGIFDNLMSAKSIDLARNGINWIHLRSLYRLPNLVSLKLSDNKINDIGMVGRVVKDLESLQKLRLDHNLITVLEEGSLVDLPMLTELYLNDNKITEIHYGAFHRTPFLKIIYLQNNRIKRIHPESFMQRSGSGVESLYLNNNEIDHIEELRSLLDSLPALKFLELSQNQLTEIPFGVLRGHGTLEQLHINDNFLSIIDRDALMAMPALRELRLRNNSLSDNLPMPFWNLPGLKGLDLGLNSFRRIHNILLAGLPSLRRLDLSENFLSSIDRITFINTPLLETLNVSHNEIKDINPSTFRNLDKLFEIDISFNKLQQIIPGLPKIVERISMRGNTITDLPSPQASKELNLPNLRMLDLSKNLLEYIPKFTFQSLGQLRVLSFAHNRIRTLEDLTFMGANRLELLHLQDNLIENVEQNTLHMMQDLRNINLQGNKIESLPEGFFANSSKLLQLDLSRNSLRNLPQQVFKHLNSVQFLDLSGNLLSELPESLSNVISVKDIDVSFNNLMHLPFNIVDAWRDVSEIRLSNNKIAELKHGTIANLPNLQYLDLSSNDIESVEPGALKNLPHLQELVLADNKLVELKDRAFDSLNSLQAVHLQHNYLRFISPEAFFNSPVLLYLNLSENNFHNMDNIGLRSMRSIELLDISRNQIKIVSPMPLKALNWLVELNMDDNLVCKIQGLPFEAMPRLRVLSMRNNRLKVLHEKTFQKLRGNIAVLDIEGNPIECSCEMQWLSVWLDETNSPNPGPKCRNGKLLRTSRLEQTNCGDYRSTNQLPLFNEHGDLFARQYQEQFSDDCEIDLTSDNETPKHAKQKPLPNETEYFYDQYVDYPINDSVAINTTPISALSNTPPSSGPQLVANTHNKVHNGINLNNTLLNLNYFNKTNQAMGSQSPTFTFFGYPLPSLGFDRFFRPNSPNQKAREQKNSLLPGIQSRGKVRMFKPTDAEFESYLKGESQFPDANARSSNRHQTIKNLEAVDDDAEEDNIPSSFMTGKFKSPDVIEKGGFFPIFPERTGGFVPIISTAESPKNIEFIENIKSNDNIKEHRTTKVSVNLITAPNILPTSGYSKFTEITEPVTNFQVITENPKSEFSTQVLERIHPTYYVTESTNRNDMIPDTSSTTARSEALSSENEDSFETSDAVEMNPSVEMLPPTTTAETILLIPPAEEQEELALRTRPWVRSDTDQKSKKVDTNFKMLSSPRSKITKVHEQRYFSKGGGPSSSMMPSIRSPNQPTAEEYYRTPHPNSDNEFQSNEFIANTYVSTEETLPPKAHGMEWYYENYQNSRRYKEVEIETAKGRPKSIFLSNASKPNSFCLVRVYLISIAIHFIIR